MIKYETPVSTYFTLEHWEKVLENPLESKYIMRADCAQGESNLVGRFIKELDNYYQKEGFTINNKSNKEEMRKLSREDYKKIHNIACNSWKRKLQSQFASYFALEDNAHFPEEFYHKMREASDDAQNKVLDSIFGEEPKKISYSIGDVFKSKGRDTKYLLCLAKGSHIQLVSLDGRRLSVHKDPLKVSSVVNISKTEFDNWAEEELLHIPNAKLLVALD